MRVFSGCTSSRQCASRRLMLSRTCFACFSVSQCAMTSSAYLSNGTSGCVLRIQSSNARCRKIGQQRAHYSPLRRSLRSCRQGSVLGLRGCLQPPLYIQEDPPAVRVLSHRAHNQRVVEVVKEASDIEIDYPIEAPASFARNSDCLQRRLLRPVPIGVRVEMWLH